MAMIRYYLGEYMINGFGCSWECYVSLQKRKGGKWALRKHGQKDDGVWMHAQTTTPALPEELAEAAGQISLKAGRLLEMLRAKKELGDLADAVERSLSAEKQIP